MWIRVKIDQRYVRMLQHRFETKEQAMDPIDPFDWRDEGSNRWSFKTSGLFVLVYEYNPDPFVQHVTSKLETRTTGTRSRTR